MQAFQCRKCRHINYDRLDAFLCVECGYCSSGTFSYELSASSASRAVAIVDDEGLERAVRLMWVVGNKYNEYKGMLIKTIQNSKLLQCNKQYQANLASSIEKLNAPLKRSLLGDLPKMNMKNAGDGSERKKRHTTGEAGELSRGESGGPSAANRARSLLNLAIQLRGDSNHEERVPDSLTRLVANIARARNGVNSKKRRKSENKNDKVENSDGETTKPEESSQKVLQNCDKVYQQLRGAERDSFELRQRVIAWKSLNQDALANHGSETTLATCTNVVSNCSYCSPTLLKNLLTLALVSFQERNATLSNTEQFRNFVSLLFDEGKENDIDLNHLKREMIIALARKSTLGSDMVFSEIQIRLQGSKSVSAADILGELIAEESLKSPEKFVELAIRTLN